MKNSDQSMKSYQREIQNKISWKILTSPWKVIKRKPEQDFTGNSAHLIFKMKPMADKIEPSFSYILNL